MSSTTQTGTAAQEGRLWSVRADDWAAIQERQVAPAYEAALDELRVGSSTRLLDAGCGAGMFLRLAADRGADVHGLDASDGLLTHARSRVPGAEIVKGELEQLPYEDAGFDVVTGFNSFQYAARPEVALAEARRVTRRGGRVLLLNWAPPELCEAAGYLMALGALLPAPPPGGPEPFALSEVEPLKALFGEVGLDVVAVADTECVWSHPDEPTAVAGLMCSGPSSASPSTPASSPSTTRPPPSSSRFAAATAVTGSRTSSAMSSAPRAAEPSAMWSASGAGEQLWFLGTLAIVRVPGEVTDGRLAVLEFLFPHGASPPLHTHPQDESYVVLEGQLTVQAGADSFELGAGGVATVPMGVPHSFRVDSDTARVLVLSTPAGIERFVRDGSVPATAPTLPPPDVPRPDAAQLEQIFRDHLQINVGPPLGVQP